MLLMNFFNPSEIESSLGDEKSKQIVDAFNGIIQALEEKQEVSFR